MVFHSFSRLILSLSFLCSSVYVALFALSFSFLSERFSSVHAKAAIAYIVEINNTGVTGRILPHNTDFEHARVWPTYFRLRFLDRDRHTYRHTYIYREISIEHPSVGLASLTQLLEKWFPLWGERAHSLKLFLYVR